MHLTNTSNSMGSHLGWPLPWEQELATEQARPLRREHLEVPLLDLVQVAQHQSSMASEDRCQMLRLRTTITTSSSLHNIIKVQLQQVREERVALPRSKVRTTLTSKSSVRRSLKASECKSSNKRRSRDSRRTPRPKSGELERPREALQSRGSRTSSTERPWTEQRRGSSGIVKTQYKEPSRSGSRSRNERSRTVTKLMIKQEWLVIKNATRKKS